jgi:competence protein ComEC
MTVFSLLSWVHFARDVDVSKLVVYNVPGHSAIDLVDHGRIFFISDAKLENDARKKRFHILPHRQMSGVVSMKKLPAEFSFRGGRLFVWHGRSVLHLTDPDFELPGPVAVDWLIVGNNAVPEIEAIRELVSCQRVLLDSSNSFFFASRFLEEAKLYKLEVHSVLHQGAFISIIENEDT